MDESTFTKFCDYAWDGFNLPSDDRLLDLSDCVVEEAIRAIYTNENGEVVLSQSTLQDNIMSLWVNDQFGSGPHNNSYIEVDEIEFTFSRTMSSFNIHPSSPLYNNNFTGTLCSGFKGSSSVSGPYSQPVHVAGSENVNLGHANLGTNEFYNPSGYAGDIHYVSVKNSEVYVRNNDFHDNGHSTLCSDGSDMVLGGPNVADGNTFSNHVTLNNGASNIENNTFEDELNFYDPTDDLLDASTYKGTDIGENTFAPNSTLQNFNSSLHVGFRVIDNDFDNCLVQLESIDRNSATDSEYGLIFNDNTINNTSGAAAGVYVEDCSYATIANNSITNYSGHTPSGGTLYGIRVDDVTNANITSNACTNFDNGIEVNGYCNGTEFTCNTLTDNYNGFYFNNNPTISDQVSGGYTNNQWTNSLNHDLEGSVISAIDWYYTGAVPDNNASNVFLRTATTNGCTTPVYYKGGEGNSDEEDVMEQKDRAFAIYPNPNHGEVQVDVPVHFNNKPIYLFDSHGSLVSKFTAREGNNILDLTEVKSGLYFLCLEGQRKKLMIR